MKNLFSNAIIVIWKVVLNPVTVISVVSLLVHNNTVVGIRAEMGIPYRMTKEQIDSSNHITPQLKELGHILNDPWNYAMSDMNMQNLILIVAFILAIYQLINGLLPLMPYTFKKTSNTTRINHEITSDNWTLIFFTISIALFIFVAWVYFGNKSANLETLQLYLPREGKITGKTHLPPWESMITKCRYFLAAYGFISAIYFNYHFEKILAKVK